MSIGFGRVLIGAATLVAMVAFLPAGGFAREFTNQQGKKIEAEIKSVEGGKVTLLMRGKPYTLDISVFVEPDRKFIREWKEKPVGTPASPATAASPAAAAAAATDDRVKPGAAVKLTFPDLTVDRKGNPAEVNLRIPEKFDASKPVPFIAWMGGGDGGNSYGPCSAMVDQTEFVMAGLPYPKGANNAGQSNMVGDFGKIAKYHEAMLAEIRKIIPNLDPNLRIVSGFSNGAHAIDGMLAEGKGGMRDFFNVYVLIDGGNGDGRYSKVSERHLYVAWGTKGKTNAVGSEEVAQKARRARMEVIKHAMEDTGHSFPQTEKELVRKWIAETVIPSVREAGG